jgi:hypothetical protein
MNQVAVKYAIQIMLAPNDWIYVTETTQHCWDLKPMLFDSKLQAEEFADTWRLPNKQENVKVVEYENS